MISQRIKSAARSVAGGAYKASPGFLAHLRGRALILMYHRVIARSEASSDFVQPGLYVAPDTFDRHLDFLTANFRIISLRDLRSQWVRGTLDPALRYCVITFDDGWRDNYVHAYPLLRAYGAPATIFLPTSFIGTEDRLWFDRLGAALRGTRPDAEIDALIERAKTMTHDDRRQLVADSEGKRARSSTRRFITWDQAREMSTHGISFGSHTCSHPILTQLGSVDLDRELRQSLARLRDERVDYEPVLSYPNGDHSSAVVRAAKEAGYVAAVTTIPGSESANPPDPMRLRRVGLHEDLSRSLPLLAFHIGHQTWPASVC